MAVAIGRKVILLLFSGLAIESSPERLKGSRNLWLFQESNEKSLVPALLANLPKVFRTYQ